MEVMATAMLMVEKIKVMVTDVKVSQATIVENEAWGPKKGNDTHSATPNPLN